MSLYDTFLAQAQQTHKPINAGWASPFANRGLAGRQASVVNDLYTGHLNTKTEQAAQRNKEARDAIGAQRDTALQEQIAQRNAAAEQAQRTLAQPSANLHTTPDLAPLQATTGVALNDALAGGNAATQAFHLSPESTQSQFTVGAPIGGGGIGQRQRASTDDLKSRTDHIGGAAKDQL